MPLLSLPFIADPMARLFAAVAGGTTPPPELRFDDIPARSSDVTIPTRHGPLAATIYRPPADAVARPPVYVNVHGGGFAVGHPEQDDPWCRYLAAHAKVVVINPDYALAPRHRFPVAVEQIYDMVAWAASPDRDWDGTRLCVGGQSAGGNLAAAAARLALESGGPQIKLQVLHYAPVDLVTRAKHKHTPAGRKAVFQPWMGDILDAAYIPDPLQRRDRLASPGWGTNADNIAGIASAVVVTAELDRLRDEAVHYARKLESAGSLVEHYDVGGVDHGYNILGDSLDITAKMYDVIAGHVVAATST